MRIGKYVEWCWRRRGGGIGVVGGAEACPGGPMAAPRPPPRRGSATPSSPVGLCPFGWPHDSVSRFDAQLVVTCVRASRFTNSPRQTTLASARPASPNPVWLSLWTLELVEKLLWGSSEEWWQQRHCKVLCPLRPSPPPGDSPPHAATRPLLSMIHIVWQYFLPYKTCMNIPGTTAKSLVGKFFRCRPFLSRKLDTS